MCLVVPYRVVAFLSTGVEVESADGQRIVVDASLTPDVAIDTYVLVDRGIVIETITSEEAQAILDMYREIASLLDTEDALT